MKVLAYTSFGEVPAAHRMALSYPRQPNFFASLDWFEVLFDTSLRSAWRPRIYVVCADDGAAQAALYCCTAADSQARTLHSMTNFYSIEYSLSVVSAGIDVATAMRSVFEHVAAERPRWHSIRLRLMKDTDLASRSAPDNLRETGFASSRFFQYDNWFLPLDGVSFNDYFARRPSQVRNTIERKSKKLRKNHTSEIVVHSQAGPGLDAAILDFTSIYNASWKQPEPWPEFIPSLARKAAELGALRLGVLHVDAQPAAAQLWITSDRRAVIYKLAYDEKFSDLGVGSVLSKELFRGAVDDDRVVEVDYGVGDESYKKDWMTSSRRLEGLEAHNLRTLLGLSLSLTDSSKSRLRDVRSALSRLTSVADGR
jgi:hypothetical protein